MSINKCEVCNENLSKYKCPGCLVKTCSLPCVKQHKRTRGCSGQRNKTKFIPMKDFKDRDLLNDYRLLEEVGRKSGNAYRDDLKRKRNKPGFVWKLTDEARKRGITLKTLPFPMSKRKHNTSCYVSKTKCILWQVELIFVLAGAKFTAKRVSEETKLEDILVPYIDPVQSDPVIRHRLKKYCTCDPGGLCVFMKVEGRPASSVRYHKFDLDKTLKENLQGKCLIEYPSLYVILSDHCDEYVLLEDKTEQSEEKSLRMQDNSKTQNSVTNAIMDTSDQCVDEPQKILDSSNLQSAASDVLMKNSKDSVEDVQKIISEDTKLEDILVPYIDPVQSDPVIRHRLKKYCTCDPGGFCVVMKVEGRPASSVRYHKFDLDKTLKENLQGKCLIEYPSLYVILSDHCDEYTLLEDKTEQSEEKSLRMQDNSKTQNSVTNAIMDTSDQCVDEPKKILDSSNVQSAESDVLMENSKDSVEDMQTMSDTSNLSAKHTCV